MAILVKNQSTGETIRVSGIKVNNGEIVPKKNNLGRRFIEAHANMLSVKETADGGQVFTLADGFELAKGTKATTKAKADEKPTTAPAPKKAKAIKAKEEKKAATSAPVAQPTTSKASDESESDNDQALLAALKNLLKGGAVDAKKVREIVAEQLEEMVKTQPKKATLVIRAAEKSTKKEVFCASFKRIVSKVSRGNNVYLYGRAGSGKSHTAEQVAAALGLDFYGQTTIQFAHDVRGYGDAGGNFQETPFFKAFADGGLYFQDEYDRSNAEAAIVLNSALANGWYDFPVVGRVEAHPNFRFMAAGNTMMSGPDEEYVTGQVIDASSRDRFAFFFEVDYSHEVELSIAHGNAEIVAFVEDVRQAIIACGIKHVVSYRATKAMIDEIENENDLQACLVEGVFKGLEVDERSVVYGALMDKENIWAKALKQTLK